MNHLNPDPMGPKGPKITKLQNEIFKAHLESFRTGFKGIERKKYTDRSQVAEDLKKGLIIPGLWDEIWNRNVSITSQLMARPSIFGYISHQAIKDMRSKFKYILNLLNIK